MHEWIPTGAATPGRAAATTSRLDATHTGDSTGRAVATRDAHPAVGIGRHPGADVANRQSV